MTFSITSFVTNFFSLLLSPILQLLGYLLIMHFVGLNGFSLVLLIVAFLSLSTLLFIAFLFLIFYLEFEGLFSRNRLPGRRAILLLGGRKCLIFQALSYLISISMLLIIRVHKIGLLKLCNGFSLGYLLIFYVSLENWEFR